MRQGSHSSGLVATASELSVACWPFRQDNFHLALWQILDEPFQFLLSFVELIV